MTRTITVKGVGRASVRPDTVEFSLDLTTLNPNYETAVTEAASQIGQLREDLGKTGFEKQDLKTTQFGVDTKYDWVKNTKGESRKVFRGYQVRHHCRLEFPFEMDRLSAAILAIAGSAANPEFSIQFTVKDRKGLKEELLRNAARDAREQAQVLCQATESGLGQLLSIQYNWGELNVYSETQLDMKEDLCCLKAAPDMEVEPEDIDLRDTATFVWEIL